MSTYAFTGGRYYANREMVARVVKTLFPGTVLVGGASGLDALVRLEAAKYGLTDVKVFAADWEKHGRAAGPIRNREMLTCGAQLLIAFPGGHGTENCVKQARELGIPVLRVEDNHDE